MVSGNSTHEIVANFALGQMTDDEVFDVMDGLDRESEKRGHCAGLPISENRGRRTRDRKKRFPGQHLAAYRNWKKAQSEGL